MSRVTNFSHLYTKVLIPFLTYLFLFVGMGFVSGSIVHFGQTSQIPRFIVIGVVGMAMFAIASYIQESVLNPEKTSIKAKIKYILYSLILAVGIGMISGGTQHFLDFPVYASYLLPSGFIIALIGYILRNNISLNKRLSFYLMTGISLISVISFWGLNIYAQGLPAGSSGHSHGHGETTAVQPQVTPTPPQSIKTNNQGEITAKKSLENHHAAITNDQEFIINMIPHHQEAVDTSAYLLTRTEDPEIKEFLQSVIDVQTKEVDQMKQWYKEWFNQPYQDQGSYMQMMPNLTVIKGAALEKAYIDGMIKHHQGAIKMANEIKPITQRDELQQMSDNIIDTQSKEVDQLQLWLGTKFTANQGSSPVNAEPKDHYSDGHNH